ncbi:MAG: helix-turn-helix domain-containing protein [Acetobacteraceae bacterium]
MAMNNMRETTDVTADWHPADVLASLKKRGTSLAALSVANGYHPTAAGKALKRPWPALEQLIANAVGMAPQQLWPSRYDAEGKPLGRVRMSPGTNRTAVAAE